MDNPNINTNSYIPLTTQPVQHYSQENSVISHAPSMPSAVGNGQGTGSGNVYNDTSVITISSKAKSPPISTTGPPPSYTISTGHETIPSQNASVSSLHLRPNTPIEMQGESGEVDQPTAYQLELQHGITSLTTQGGGEGHRHYPVVWLSNSGPHGLKGSIPNSVPLPPVSEVHPSRGPKLAPRLNESNSTSTQQRRPVGESDCQSDLHSYLTQALPNIQESAMVKVPTIDPSSISLPSLQATKVQHHDHLLAVTTAEHLSSDGLLTDVSSAVSSLDRTSNIYSIAPSQATAVTGSHALTLDTSVHTQLPAMMQHHSHDVTISSTQSGHFPSNLIHLELGLEVDMDKEQHQQQIHHPTNVLIGANIPMTTADISNVLAEHRTHIMDNFNVIYSSSGAHNDLNQLKHNNMSQDGTTQMIPAAHQPGIHLPTDFDSMHLQDAFQQSAAGGEAKDLVETLACYRCKVCPFISFSKEGVEQHVRSTHLKQEVETNEPPREEAVPELCAQEIEIHQQQSVENDLEHSKENTYICGMCDRGFTDIESCSVHMTVEHNLPADAVTLEPLSTMQSQAVPETTLSQPQVSLAIHLHQSRPLQPLLTAEVTQPHKHSNLIQQADSAQCIQERQHCESQQSVHGQQLPGVAKPKVAKRKKTIKKPQHENRDMENSVIMLEEKECIESITIKLETDEKRESGTSAENQDSCGETNADSADSSLNNPGSKSGTKKRGRPKGSKTLGITALKKKNRTCKTAEDHLLGFRCDVHGCAVRMQSLDNLEYHRKCHTEDMEQFECPECNARYDNWKSISIHLWRTHVVDMELYSCDLCSYKTYSYGKLMNMHRRIHSDERLFMCDVCGRCFKTNKQLRNHKVIHLDKRKSRSFRSGECDICNRHFSDKRMLRVHKDTVHNKLRPYLCQYCSYTASCRSTLKMHIRQHTGEKPFVCEMCDYRTADHNSLRRHKMRHSGEKPYKCPFCPYKSIQSSTYKTHLKNKHPGLDEGLLFSCDHCPFRTIKKENYVTHMADHKNGGLSERMSASSNHDMQGVRPAATSIAPKTGLNSPIYFSPHPHSQSSASSDVTLQTQMDGVPFIFSVPDEIRQRLTQQQIYAVVDSDNPEERFPILASQLKIGQVVGSQTENEEAHILPHTSMEASRHIQIISSQLVAQEQVVHDSSTDATGHVSPTGEQHSASQETLSHAQLTPVPPETILPN